LWPRKVGICWDIGKVDKIEHWICLENASMRLRLTGGSECPLCWEVIGYRVSVVFRGMVKEVTKGGEEAPGVVIGILGVAFGKV
jgi:hypothetical protein